MGFPATGRVHQQLPAVLGLDMAKELPFRKPVSQSDAPEDHRLRRSRLLQFGTTAPTRKGCGRHPVAVPHLPCAGRTEYPPAPLTEPVSEQFEGFSPAGSAPGFWPWAARTNRADRPAIPDFRELYNIFEYTRYRIPDERRKAFVEAYRQAAAYLKSSPHCLAYELTHCLEEKNRYVLRIEWKSEEEHLQGFRKEPGFKDFFQLVQPYVSNIEEMQHYGLTDVVYRT